MQSLREEVMNMDEVKAIADLAKTIFLHDGYHVPVVYVKGTTGKTALGLKLGDTSDAREMDMLNAGTFLACKHHVGDLELLIYVCEAWMGTNLNVLPSKDPNHIEVLLINSLDIRTNKEALQAFEIKRDPKGNVLDLQDLRLPESVETQGRLLPAFLKGYQIISPVHN